MESETMKAETKNSPEEMENKLRLSTRKQNKKDKGMKKG